MVLDSGLAFTTQTRVLPKHTPALKKDIWDAIRLARFNPDIGSIGSNASSGNVITCRSIQMGGVSAEADS